MRSMKTHILNKTFVNVRLLHALVYNITKLASKTFTKKKDFNMKLRREQLALNTSLHKKGIKQAKDSH